MHALQERASWLQLMAASTEVSRIKEVSTAGMLAAGDKSTEAHGQAPTETNRQVLRKLGRTKSN